MRSQGFWRRWRCKAGARGVVVGIGVVVVLGLSGCGSGSPSNPKIDAGKDVAVDVAMDMPVDTPMAEADSCASVGCSLPPLCSVGCTARCGCCPCADGTTMGGDGGTLRCMGGCWMPTGDGGTGTGGGATGGAGGGAGATGTGSGGSTGATGGRGGNAGMGAGGNTTSSGGRAGGAGGTMTSGGGAGTAGTGVGGAAGASTGGVGGSSSSGAVDIIFMVDDSNSMSPLQAQLAQAFSGFMNTLESLPGGLPSLHIAVITSSLGAGVFGNVTGCTPGTDGNRGGAFIHPATCTALPPGEHFLNAEGAAKNFTGDISDVFACMAMVGAAGCGFEHQFEATRWALVKAQTPTDADNAGFLRPNAHLAIIMLTNEDDCSVSADSMLFDPNQQTIADPLGGLQSYRCNEFGHLCGGVAPPHQPPATPLTLDSCVSNETGPLTRVADFITFVKGLKPTTDKIFVAAMAGPVTPYIVESKSFMLGNGGTENQPTIRHSCMNPSGTYADPAVRVKTWVDAFGTRGTFESVCPDNLGPPMMRIAQSLAAAIHP